MPRKRKQPRDGGGAWSKYALLAALIAVLWARTPSAPARRLERQLERGRALFEASNWRDAVAALDLRKHAAALRTDAERRAFWPRLHEAAAHRAQSALRAADLAETAAARRRGIEQAVSLFEAALAMDARAYTFLDFVYDSCRAYWRLGRGADADALFEAARSKSEALLSVWKSGADAVTGTRSRRWRGFTQVPLDHAAPDAVLWRARAATRRE